MKDRLLALGVCLVLSAGCSSSSRAPGLDGGGATAGGGASGGAGGGAGGGVNGGGTGGGAGSSGAAGSAGTSGGGGGHDAGSTSDASDDAAPTADGGTACFPACLTDVGVPCPRIGQSCVSSTAANGDVSSCYANGVKALATTTVTSVKQANGDACFHINLMTGGQDYVAPDGTVVAHLASTASSMKYVVTCPDGTVTMVDLTSPECAAAVAGMQTCTSGSCSY
jgi:hypothetical protein